MGKVFRRAAFGGFRRKEVIDYLDSLSQEQKLREARNAEDLNELENQIRLLTTQLHASEEREAGLREAAERREAELEALEAALEAKLADTRQRLEATLGEQTALRRAVEQLQEEKTELVREKLALIEEKNRLSSRILDFDDERRVFEAERQQTELEMAEQRRELESRIFDLEAEVLEGLEKKTPQPTPVSEAFARRIAQALAQPDTAGPHDVKPPTSEPETSVTPPEKKPGGRVVVRRPGQVASEPDSVAQVEATPPSPQPQAPHKEKAKLGSVRDILRYVRKR